MAPTDFDCPFCGAEARVIKDQGSMVLVHCDSCGEDSYFRVHPIHLAAPAMPLSKVYKAFVEVGAEDAVIKQRIKVKFVFEGFSNFRLGALERQINQGDKRWNLGFYSEGEMNLLIKKAEKYGLDISFMED